MCQGKNCVSQKRIRARRYAEMALQGIMANPEMKDMPLDTIVETAWRVSDKMSEFEDEIYHSEEAHG